MACDAELGTLANRADGERQHVAAIGMERSIRIVARRDQFAAQAEHRSGPVRGDSFGVTTVRASERSVERSLREWFLAINLFIDGLLMAAWQRDGRWTVYRSPNGKWSGTLLQALTILQQYLPPQFFPVGAELGRSVEHVRKKLKDYIAKNQEQRR